ncbi:ATP-grasp peptide maturase system methyltransferase [Actinomadura atramentaria]|uniref:ATP-grasp peptide maturase system methyltransferase n=1 Tax=Actinomadura atramentaria TaxID=1990 RepID=UPI00038121F0|nr:ATP-grasp peptide maturase system methyltransferase [Actinomadura atramentaria]
MSDRPADAARLRAAMTARLTDDGALDDAAWRAAVAAVPRHRFVPGFYLSADEPDELGLPVWEPVTAALDRERWLAGAYSNSTLVTQFDGEEPDWKAPAVRHGGFPTSSATLPSLVIQMWTDAQISDGHTVLEIGTGTGYSTALACERLGAANVTSIDVDAGVLTRAAAALHGVGLQPTVAVADGLYGYWPEAPFDRIVAACSFRTVPSALLAQTRPGGRLLLPLSGWLHGSARTLLTVAEDGTAEGPLLPGTISFMPVRVHAAPPVGNPGDWLADVPSRTRPARHAPERIDAPTEEAFHLRFLAQCAAPNAQLVTLEDRTYLIDVVTGSAAVLVDGPDGWAVREGGPLEPWSRIEDVIDRYDAAGRPGPEEFRLRVSPGGRLLQHPEFPDGLTLP